MNLLKKKKQRKAVCLWHLEIENSASVFPPKTSLGIAVKDIARPRRFVVSSHRAFPAGFSGSMNAARGGGGRTCRAIGCTTCPPTLPRTRLNAMLSHCEIYNTNPLGCFAHN